MGESEKKRKNLLRLVCVVQTPIPAIRDNSGSYFLWNKCNTFLKKLSHEIEKFYIYFTTDEAGVTLAYLLASWGVSFANVLATPYSYQFLNWLATWGKGGAGYNLVYEFVVWSKLSRIFCYMFTPFKRSLVLKQIISQILYNLL